MCLLIALLFEWFVIDPLDYALSMVVVMLGLPFSYVLSDLFYTRH